MVGYADTISITFLYLFLFSITDLLFQKVYLNIRQPVRQIVEDHANSLKIIPKVEYFFGFVIAVGIISLINYFLVPIISEIILTSEDPWMVVLGLFVVLYLLVMNWFFPRFYNTLNLNR